MKDGLQMIDIIKWSLIFLGTLAVVTVSLPLLGAAVFFGRFVLIALVPAAVLVVLVSPAIRSRLALESGGDS